MKKIVLTLSLTPESVSVKSEPSENAGVMVRCVVYPGVARCTLPRWRLPHKSPRPRHSKRARTRMLHGFT
jgi:hypothetical protein